jgi:hypothetical protein
MAGFAVFMTVVIYGFLGIVLATVVSITLVLLARKRLPQGLAERSAFLKDCRFAPFSGLLWLVAAFLIHVQISNMLAHQDCGLSGDPYVTLPNGYVLGSHNTYDGYIVAPGYKTDVPVTGPGYVRSLIDVHWKNGVFTGTQFDSDAKSSGYIRGFTFDTRDLSIRTFDPPPVTWHEGEPSPLEHPFSYWNLYAKYRHRWPNYIFIALILAGEVAIASRLWRRWTLLRRHSIEASLSAPLPTPPQSPPESTSE